MPVIFSHQFYFLTNNGAIITHSNQLPVPGLRHDIELIYVLSDVIPQEKLHRRLQSLLQRISNRAKGYTGPCEN
ncbi:hypothetical protein TUM12370_30340 [Salmonella enterica subsp. enterica serovar Choleraesuis]|nr:hypothetical protein TUM12370_30340 [Salmonella enterica subsp. enterica serovar Choleraesuis]